MAIDSKCFIENGVMHIQFHPKKPEVQTMTIDDVTCWKCNMIASLDIHGYCEFCRRPPAPARYGLIARVASLFKKAEVPNE